MIVSDLNQQIQLLIETSKKPLNLRYYIVKKDEHGKYSIIKCAFSHIEHAKEMIKNYETNHPACSYYLVKESSTLDIVKD